MSNQTIRPTEQAPLILLSKTQRGTNATKIWHVVKDSNPTTRREEVWSASCKLNKQGIPPTWGKPKLLTPPSTTVALIQYNQPNNKFEIAFILSTAKITLAENLPQPIEHFVNFATNPAHTFSHEQTQALNLQLRSWMKPHQYQQFLSLWPNAASQTAAEEPPPIQAFPTTIEQALAAQALGKESTSFEPPTLVFVTQPIATPLLIPNLQATNFRTPSTKPETTTCQVLLKITPSGKQNRRREVFYATPTAPTLRNPQAAPYPISPLKATVALLYADVNPRSQTFNQPVVCSINLAASTIEEGVAFLAQHGNNMSAAQLAEFSPPSHNLSTTGQHQPKIGETFMSQQRPCALCDTLFQPVRSSSKFCSEQCRVNFHSKGRAKQAKPPAQTQPTAPAENFVTQSQFQSLEGRVDQILQILTNK